MFKLCREERRKKSTVTTALSVVVTHTLLEGVESR